MTEMLWYAPSDESSIQMEVESLGERPGEKWTADEFERYLEHLYDTRYNDLVAIGQRRLGSMEAGEDAWSDFVARKMAPVIHAFDPKKGRALYSWISYKFDFFCRDLSRTRRVHQAKLDEFSHVTVDVLFGHGVDSSRALEAHDLVQNILQSLSKQERDLFIARYIQERPLKAIASASGISVGTIKSRLFALRKRVVAVAACLGMPRELREKAQAQ